MAGPVFIVGGPFRGFSAGLVNAVVGGGGVAPAGGGSSSSGSTSRVPADTAFTFTTVAPKAPAATVIPGSTDQVYANDQLAAQAQAKLAQQRAVSVAGNLAELERLAADSQQLTVAVEQQWSAVQAGTATASDFVEYIASRRSRADANLQLGQLRMQAIQSTAGADGSLATAVVRANTALSALQARAGRLAELERFGLEQRGSMMVTAPATKSGFPWWGYAIAGVVVIGGAVYFGGK